MSIMGGNVIECPICKSKRIAELRHDSDWGGGNTYDLVNSDEYYDAYDLKLGDYIPDIDVYNCFACDFTWNVYGNIEKLLEIIKNNLI